MKAIIKSILVLSLMIIFVPVSNTYAQDLSRNEILELCDDGVCPDKTYDVVKKTSGRGGHTSGTADKAKEVAIENAKNRARKAAEKAAQDAAEVIAEAARKGDTSSLPPCDENCKSDVIFVSEAVVEDLRCVSKVVPGSSGFFASARCYAEATVKITRFCVSADTKQCKEDEKALLGGILK